MKKILAFMFAVLMIGVAHAEPLATFAGVSWDTPAKDIAQVLTEKTGITFVKKSGIVESENFPSITYMKYPVAQITADFQNTLKQIVVYIEPFEIDKYATGEVGIFDGGKAAGVLAGAEERFGAISCGLVSVYNEIENIRRYATDDLDEVPDILVDTITLMQSQGYKEAQIELAYTSTVLGFSITDISDQALYGNIGVFMVTPCIQYTNLEISRYLDISDYEQFPMKNGKRIYKNDF